MLGVSALVTALDGMQIKVGGSVILNSKQPLVISTGVAYAWTGDGFGVKVRGGLVRQAGYSVLGYVVYLPIQTITFEVMPFISVGEKGQVLVSIGLTQDNVWRTYDTTLKTSSMGWYATPAYRLNIDGGAFKIGFQLFNNINSGGNIGINGKDYVKWNIPMLLAFNF